MLAFLTRLCSPDKLAGWPPEAQQGLQAAFMPRGQTLVRLLIAGACGALPVGRVPDIADALYAILKVFPQALSVQLCASASYSVRQDCCCHACLGNVELLLE